MDILAMMKKSITGMLAFAICMAAGLVVTTSCQSQEGSEDQLKTYADSFAIRYYNWQFPDAAKYCTPTSEQWLRYAASNVHESDVELLRQKDEDATVEIKHVDFDNDTSAHVTLSVSNFLQMDSIGQEAHLVPGCEVQLAMEMHEGKWKVNLDRLP